MSLLGRLGGAALLLLYVMGLCTAEEDPHLNGFRRLLDPQSRNDVGSTDDDSLSSTDSDDSDDNPSATSLSQNQLGSPLLRPTSGNGYHPTYGQNRYPAYGQNGYPAYGQNGYQAYGQNRYPAYGQNGNPTYGQNGYPAYGQNGYPAYGQNGYPAYGQSSFGYGSYGTSPRPYTGYPSAYGSGFPQPYPALTQPYGYNAMAPPLMPGTATNHPFSYSRMVPPMTQPSMGYPAYNPPMTAPFGYPAAGYANPYPAWGATYPGMSMTYPYLVNPTTNGSSTTTPAPVSFFQPAMGASLYPPLSPISYLQPPMGSTLASPYANGAYNAVMDPSHPMNNPFHPMNNPNHPVNNPDHPVNNPNQVMVDPFRDPYDPVNDPSHPANDPTPPLNNPNHPINDPNLPLNNPNHPVNNPLNPMNDPYHPMNSPNHPMNNPAHPMNNRFQPMYPPMYPTTYLQPYPMASPYLYPPAINQPVPSQAASKLLKPSLVANPAPLNLHMYSPYAEAAQPGMSSFYPPSTGVYNPGMSSSGLAPPPLAPMAGAYGGYPGYGGSGAYPQWPAQYGHMWPLHPMYQQPMVAAPREGLCSLDKPFHCWGSQTCVPLEAICDKTYDCYNHMDEDPQICIVGRRPEYDVLVTYLGLPDQQWMMTKLFNNVGPYYTAYSLRLATSLEDLHWSLALTEENVNNTRTVFEAVKKDDQQPLIDMGMKESSWEAVKFLFTKLRDTGFYLS